MFLWCAIFFHFSYRYLSCNWENLSEAALKPTHSYKKFHPKKTVSQKVPKNSACDKYLMKQFTQPCHSCWAEEINWQQKHLEQSLTWSTVSNSGLPSTRETQSSWGKYSTGLLQWLRVCSISHLRTGWGSWACSAQRREGSRENLIKVYNLQKEGVKRMRPNLFLVVPGNRTRGSRHKLNHSSTWTRGRTSLLWRWSTGRGCRERLQSPLSWRYTRAVWARVMCSKWLVWAGRLNYITVSGPFQPQTFSDSVKDTLHMIVT